VYTAKFMGFQGSPPAYLTLPRPIHVGKGFTGINYACTGAGLRDLDPNVSGHAILFSPANPRIIKMAEQNVLWKSIINYER
jgi:hypothetical protein